MNNYLNLNLNFISYSGNISNVGFSFRFFLRGKRFYLLVEVVYVGNSLVIVFVH